MTESTNKSQQQSMNLERMLFFSQKPAMRAPSGPNRTSLEAVESFYSLNYFTFRNGHIQRRGGVSHFSRTSGGAGGGGEDGAQDSCVHLTGGRPSISNSAAFFCHILN